MSRLTPLDRVAPVFHQTDSASHLHPTTRHQSRDGRCVN